MREVVRDPLFYKTAINSELHLRILVALQVRIKVLFAKEKDDVGLHIGFIESGPVDWISSELNHM